MDRPFSPASAFPISLFDVIRDKRVEQQLPYVKGDHRNDADPTVDCHLETDHQRFLTARDSGCDLLRAF